jgi:hypothetical protein
LAGTDHPRLINHHDDTRGQTLIVRFTDQSGEGDRGDPGSGLEAGGGPPGQRPTQDRGAGDGGELADHFHHRGLPGPGWSDPDVDGVGGGGEPADHLPLPVSQLGVASQPPLHQPVGCSPSTGTDTSHGLFDDPLLGDQQFGSRVTVFVSHTGEECSVPAAHQPPGCFCFGQDTKPVTLDIRTVEFLDLFGNMGWQERHDVPGSEECFGEVLDLSAGATIGECPGDLFDHLGPAESGGPFGEPLRRRQPFEQHLHINRGDLPAATHHLGEPVGGETHLDGPLSPFGFEILKGMVLLWGTGGQHRDLPGRGCVRKALFLAPGFELVATPGERLDLGAGEPDNVGHPIVDRLPPNPQPLRQLPSEYRFVKVPGGQLKPIQQPAIHRPPHPIDTFDLVGHHHMGMELRVVGPGSELGERSRHIPRSADRPGHHPKPRCPIIVENRIAVLIKERSLGGASG